MESKRLVEMLGSAIVGAGLTVLAYEFMDAGDGEGSRSKVSATDESDADEDAEGGGDGEGAPTAGAGEDEDGAEGSGGEAQEGGQPEPAGGGPAGEAYQADAEGHYKAFPGIFAETEPMDAAAEAEYPKYGLVTGGAATVRSRADVNSPRVGLLRAGTRVRSSGEKVFGGGCSQGWREIYPKGWVCMNAGLQVSDTEPDAGGIDVARPNIDEPMPLDYWRVNHDGTPFFHRLPSYEEQDRSDTAAKDWLATKGREPMPTHPAKRPGNVPAVVKEYLNAGFYVTIASEHLRSKRRFLKTNRGVYARKYQLEKRDGSEFKGRVLPNGAQDLPIHWVVRSMPLEKREAPNSGIMVKTELQPERRTTYPFTRKVRIGDYDYYVDDEGNHLRGYAVGVSKKIKRPPGIGSEERWVHVDLSEQTLVAYIGERPVFTTIVSTGKEKGMTPVGVHRIQSKHIVTSMRDQPVEEEAYSIEDVPWTQYFDNNVALHGAFWHGGFGLVRSHGCVNLSPSDARWLFGFTSPALPQDWHSAFAENDADKVGPSAVVVTE